MSILISFTIALLLGIVIGRIGREAHFKYQKRYIDELVNYCVKLEDTLEELLNVTTATTTERQMMLAVEKSRYLLEKRQVGELNI